MVGNENAADRQDGIAIFHALKIGLSPRARPVVAQDQRILVGRRQMFDGFDTDNSGPRRRLAGERKFDVASSYPFARRRRDLLSRHASRQAINLREMKIQGLAEDPTAFSDNGFQFDYSAGSPIA
ncbi:hypothetical protein [Candidatus Rhodoblastus alkanivorans]|uniref:hypothetical protein n=1 Tax=Candidatus Rhodoblastus alkanivorans TaxID=2954117 RepID=UPI001FAA50FF|nr:hypothetical protein [Candidatus Rhodoblastus alkanivorans]